MNPADPRLEALQRYCDGTATREEVAIVERAIVDDADYRKLAVEYLHLDSAMEEFAALDEITPDAERMTRTGGTTHSGRAGPRIATVGPFGRSRWALAVAAAVALTGLVLWHWQSAKTSPSEVEVEVLSLVDAKFAKPHDSIHAHDHARLASFSLESGEAYLRLASDVKLVVSGPAELRFVDPMHARLAHGKVTVDCGARGKGFILDTPVARVVDVSTQFGVEARTDGATDVMVIKGNVEVFNPQQTQLAAPLEQGEAVRVDAKQAVARIVSITGGLEAGEWSTRPPATECNIASVSDNFGAAEGFHFYRIVSRGLRPGSVVYSNRNYVWRPVTGQEFPASLMNADVVQTFFGELTRPAYAIEITVARPVSLYVLMPRRGIPPPWLTESFTRTDDEIMLDESPSASRPPHLFFEVWKREVPQAGKVTLGPGNRDANGNPVGMYGIAAKPLSL